MLLRFFFLRKPLGFLLARKLVYTVDFFFSHIILRLNFISALKRAGESKLVGVLKVAAYGYASWVQGYLDDDVEKIVDGWFVEPGRGSGSVRTRSPAGRKTSPKGSRTKRARR